MTNTNLSPKTVRMVLTAILAAIMIILTFTPIGYLKTAGVEISFLTIPIVIGAITLGPGTGALLGGIFGITSFIQCFGLSPFGAALLAINPFYTFILCMVPRILMGWLTGLIFKALTDAKSNEILSLGITSLSGALLNTLLFVTTMILLFGNSDYIKGMQGSRSLMSFLIAFVGLNGLVEAIVATVLGTAISKALLIYRRPLK